ncbi:protoporphyrinogen oxidase HemJ [Legionella spiritensis]|uniref:Protoporphyrinogen IX oxidase n=1 Tax=Legionella spiritensis TaxID=452 RepID=A0A0W0YYU3_LEGSP|nr:protoporphyrinogen oxidase HemJ [Legionella spiritensis]KTD61790.1 transmembrane protein [Legionella spiritensis]SNV38245.1 transmembrane protein [Legionella spiritensis]
MLVIKAFHIIAMVAWFAGLFYLPRLFVYHSGARDKISLDRFKVMERRLYYGIMWPSALITILLGILLLHYNWHYYLHAGWMHVKITLVILLAGYHLTCGHFVKTFSCDGNTRSDTFYRVFNEIPTLFLIAIVLLVVIKPF